MRRLVFRKIRHAQLEVVVNTWNRTELAVQTINSLRGASTIPIKLTVVDDGSTCDELSSYLHTSADELLELDHVGPGKARKLALINASNTPGPKVVLFCDSDLLFRRGYDAETLKLVQLGTGLRAVASPYRSNLHLSKDHDYGSVVIGRTYGGATLAMERQFVQEVLSAYPEDWDELYDWNLCGKFPAVKPACSLVEHLGGNHAEALHQGSPDKGFKFSSD